MEPQLVQPLLRYSPEPLAEKSLELPLRNLPTFLRTKSPRPVRSRSDHAKQKRRRTVQWVAFATRKLSPRRGVSVRMSVHFALSERRNERTNSCPF